MVRSQRKYLENSEKIDKKIHIFWLNFSEFFKYFFYFEKKTKKNKFSFSFFFETKKIFLKLKILNENLLTVYPGSETLKSAILASNSFWAPRTKVLKNVFFSSKKIHLGKRTVLPFKIIFFFLSTIWVFSKCLGSRS